AFLKNLLSLQQGGQAPKKIVIPDGLYARMNERLLRRLCNIEELRQMMGEDAVLDISKQGLRRKPGYIDRTPNLKEPALETELALVRDPEAKTEMATDKVVANLVLFRAVMAARIEIYKLGETKSAAKRSNNEEKYEQASTAMRAYARVFEEFNQSFPFDNIDNRQKVKDDIAGVIKWLDKLNNPIADSILVGLSRRTLESIDQILGTLSKRALEDLERAEDVRSRQAISRQERRGLQVARGKIRIVDSLRGDCIITSQGYKNTAAGILSNTMIEHDVSTRKILSMMDHEIESAQAEKARNAAFIFGLKVIAEDPLAWFDKLYEINVQMAQVRDIGKRKALAEISGARHLLAISQQQAHKLAGQLIIMAAHDLERRNEVLDVQVARLTQLKAQTEELIGEVLKQLAWRWAKYFAAPDRNLRDAKRLNRINSSLGKYLGTLLGPKKEDLREYWMRQARSHITGILRQMSAISRPLKELAQLNKKKRAMQKRGIRSAQQRLELRILDGEVLQLHDQVDERLNGASIKAARQILRIEFDFINRGKTWKKGERQTALRAFYREKAEIYGARLVIGSGTQTELDLGR
ncbi:hypothetical protein ACFL1W_01920, partial [Candidatus Margulisiibacteriota bacterium]